MKFKALVRLLEECIEEALDEIIEDDETAIKKEVSTSAGAGGYQTPGAFRGNSKGGRAKMKRNATVGTHFTLIDGDEESADPI